MSTFWAILGALIAKDMLYILVKAAVKTYAGWLEEKQKDAKLVR